MSGEVDMVSETPGLWTPDRLLVLSFCASFLTWLGSTDVQAQTAHIRLRGSSHLSVQAVRDAGKLVLSGAVDDDAARPIRRGRVRISFAHASDPSARDSAPVPATDAEACDGLDISIELDRSGVLLVTTDNLARFCIRVGIPTDRYTVHLEARGSELLDGSAIDVPLDLTLPLLTLRFDPEPTVVSLDEETISVDVIASTEGRKGGGAADGLALTLSNEQGSRLATATTDAFGHARFIVDGGRLGSPGKGELRATFAGNTRAGPITRSTRVERRTVVDIVAPSAIGGRLPVASIEEGVALRLLATPKCARNGCKVSPIGMIEATAGGSTLVGTALLDRGEAGLAIHIATPAGALATTSPGEVPLLLRYIPNVPWFRPAGEITLVQPVRGPSAWSRVPLVLAATAVVTLLAFGRLVPRTLYRGEPAPTAPILRTGHVQLVRSAPVSRDRPPPGWTGRVADAHDGLPIARAKVAIERRGFETAAVLVDADSDAGGSFALPWVDARPGDELVARGRDHVTLRRPLPPSGELAVALVLRKRALLDRLVAWARWRGSPYDNLPDATPEHVRRAAGSNVDVARWARAIEQAVYGGSPIDEGTQAELDRLAPPSDR